MALRRPGAGIPGGGLQDSSPSSWEQLLGTGGRGSDCGCDR